MITFFDNHRELFIIISLIVLLLVNAGNKNSDPKIDIESQSLINPAVTQDTAGNNAQSANSSPEEEVTNTEVYEVSNEASSFKSYMDYRALTDTSSTQYEMQQDAYTDSNGLRKIGKHFCVAMGTYYGKLGDILHIETDEGATWTVILSDIKSDVHTDSTHRYTTANNCMMEFIVDTNAMNYEIKQSGTVNALGFQGKICKVTKIN